MRRLKRVIAGVLTACLIATSNVPVAFAEEPSTKQEAETEVYEDVNTNTDAIAEQEISDSEGNPVDDETDEDNTLRYIVVESDYVQTPDTQYVLADINISEGTISTATLVYTNQSTGVTYNKDVDVISDTALLFNLNFEDETSTGIYKLLGIKYTVDEVEQYIDLDAVGASDVFGVNVTADSHPDAWIVDEDSVSDENAGITVTDVSSGESISGYDIADAISELQGDDAGTLMQTASDGSLVVVLDAGHSGSDCGTLNTINGVTYYERDINLKIANYCKEELEKYSGVTVYMTRTDNTTEWSIIGRVQRAAELGADVLVSIHVNSGGATATGALVIVPNSNYRPDLSSEASALGNEILSKLSELGLYNRGNLIRTFTNGEADNPSQENYPDGSKADYYGICRYSKRSGFSGIIIEHAFLSNPTEAAKYLTSDEMLKQLGIADATAIAQYYGLGADDGSSYLTSYNGVNYSAVYDYNYYIEHNADVKAACGSNQREVLKHFVTYGMKEGRRASADFDVKSYRNAYVDLRKAYGTDLTKYYMHYINYGKKENRTATGVTTLRNPLTVYNGVDYSAVYDYNYYIEHNTDIKKAYEGDDIKALQHFVNYGMKEGRRAKADFDVKSYKNAYVDLRKAYGNDLVKYYLHYINYGLKEKRKATGVTTLTNPITVYDGVDYSPVYDYNYYLANNADVKKAYDGDENATLKHFVTYGMKEGRKAKATFDVKFYRAKYKDLYRAYGKDLVKYYLHYINYGVKENRTGNGDWTGLPDIDDTYYSIMGTSSTNVKQMVAYYNAYAAYPEYYKNSDAPTINDFCQIYIEECEAEGVKAEVAFAQAMKETGFLRFGGSVKIEQYNFAGLGATGGGVTGASFSSVRMGIRAQVQHLKAYASTDALKNECVDTRFIYVTRGSAPYVEWLGINENPSKVGWATAIKYGYSIIDDYIAKLMKY